MIFRLDYLDRPNAPTPHRRGRLRPPSAAPVSPVPTRHETSPRLRSGFLVAEDFPCQGNNFFRTRKIFRDNPRRRAAGQATAKPGPAKAATGAIVTDKENGIG